MSVRCIWIVSVASENFGKILFIRKFQTVERRAQVFLDNYVSIPSEKQFSISLLSALCLSKESKQFVDWRDKASKDIHLPVVKLKFKDKELWPILIVEQGPYLLCCLPYVSSSAIKELFQSSSVSVAFVVLVKIWNYLTPNRTSLEENSKTFVELDNYLTLIMPFGEPSDWEFTSAIAPFNVPSSAIKQNSWKQLSSKGKSQMNMFIEINENVRSAQSEIQGFNLVEVYGNIRIKLDSVNVLHELWLNMEHSSGSKALELESIFLHPCVQSFMPGNFGSIIPKKLWLLPFSKKFTLCFYNARFNQPPIYGVFKMKGKSSVELFVQLKLNENMKNIFSLCEVFIPFSNQATVKNFEFKVTQGFLHISEDRRSLKWNVGTKFSSKSLDAFLTAKVSLNIELKNVHDDSFCYGRNAFIQINFKQINETFSGCSIDIKSVTVSPPQKIKIFTDSSVQSTEYKIWNSLGDLPFPIIPLENCNQE